MSTQLINNLKTARLVLEAWDEKRFALNAFKVKTPTGKVYYDILGVLAMDPTFVKAGFGWNDLGVTLDGFSLGLAFANGDPLVLSCLDQIFGPHSHHRLFKARYQGFWDNHVLQDDYTMTDLQLAIIRINKQIMSLDLRNWR